MSIQMTLVFGTLILEMVVLFGLVLPLPLMLRQRFVEVANILKNLKNFKIGTAFTTILLLMQFVDCLQRLKKYDYISNPYYTTSGNEGAAAAAAGYGRPPLTSEQLASKFYSQRNLYITGAVLYLEIAIATVLPIIRKLVAKEAEYRKLSTLEKEALSSVDTSEAEKLKKLIAAKDLDIATFKKQIQGLQRSYDDLTKDEVVDKKSD